MQRAFPVFGGECVQGARRDASEVGQEVALRDHSEARGLGLVPGVDWARRRLTGRAWFRATLARRARQVLGLTKPHGRHILEEHAPLEEHAARDERRDGRELSVPAVGLELGLRGATRRVMHVDNHLRFVRVPNSGLRTVAASNSAQRRY